jgi:hypothetical protein
MHSSSRNIDTCGEDQDGVFVCKSGRKKKVLMKHDKFSRAIGSCPIEIKVLGFIVQK